MSRHSELTMRLNGETATVRWHELERHFARGSVVSVAPGLDLVAVAAAFVEDDRARVAEWMARAQVQRAAEDDARRWSAADAELWAVVVAPWVLVQPR